MNSRKVILLNASNIEEFPVYPYAFIQVPAVARREGIEVVCKDLLGEPQTEWEQIVRSMIAQHNPAMILVTLRNTDSLVSEDYQPNKPGQEGKNAYFPIENTRELIKAIRNISDLPITLGGFGFSLLAEEIMHYLHPDFGVFGGSDGFFAHLKDIKEGNLNKVPNLLYFQDGKLICNPLIYYPPMAEPEYTPQVITKMMDFYTVFPTPGLQGAPVEIMRGCSHACVFCAEPHVAGRQVRYRDLSAVMKDIKTLADNGINNIYIISSELNPNGNEYVLELAEKILEFNQQQPEDHQVSWYGANYLLNFSFEEYEVLGRSGFTGGWFDITALDDQNALAMKTPYRNTNLIPQLKTYARFKRTQLETPSKDNPQLKDTDNSTPAISWTLFLGNPATTTETIRNTLRTTNQEGLAQLFTSCSLSPILRVFDYENPDNATLEVTYSVNPKLERTEYQQIFPSFASPPALLQEFSSAKEIKNLFDHLAETYLSTKYKTTRSWHNFIRQHASYTSVESWIETLSKRHDVHWPSESLITTAGKVSPELQRLFMELPENSEDKHKIEHMAEKLVVALLSASFEVFPVFFESLDLPASMDKLIQTTPYELAVRVFIQWGSEKEFFDELSKQTSPEMSELMQNCVRFCIQAILHWNNVLIKPKYQKLFCSQNAS